MRPPAADHRLGSLFDAIRALKVPINTIPRPASLPIAHHLPQPAIPQHYLLAQPRADAKLPSPSILHESRRLNDQHISYLRACKGHLLHPDIASSPHRFKRVLDVGCGTGIWLRDLVSSPLLSSIPHLEAHGCDIDLRLARSLPRPLGPQSSRFKFFRHDITMPFVSARAQEHNVGLAASYDLVHARLLIFALQKGDAGWQNAVRNMAAFLKPRGVLQLSDLNAIAQPYQLPTPAARLSNITILNRLSRQALALVNKDVYAGNHLESYMAGAGLSGITSRRFRIPFGKAAKDQGWTDREVKRADQTALKAFVGLKRPFLALGGLHGIGSTSQEFDAFLAKLEEEIREEGMLLDFTMTYGQKP